MADIDGMMAKVAALIANAESYQAQGNSEAAASYRAKAEELMRKYRIEEEQLVRTATSSGAPVWRYIEIVSDASTWGDQMHQMFWWIAAHCGVEYRLTYKGYNDLQADTVGYEIDLRLCEMIFNSARLAFLARMEPKFDPTLSAEENIYALRGSGMDRQRVAKLVFGQEGHSEGIKVGKVYRAECERRGEADGVSGRGFNPNIYRAAYAKAFVYRIADRLRAARDAADATGGALVLPQRAERVKEALYVKYPDERPMTAEQMAYYAEHPEERPKPSKPRKVTKAEENAYYRKNHSPAARRAQAAGRDAAETVDLVREAPTSQRTGSAERTALGG